MKKQLFIPLAVLALLAGGATAFASNSAVLEKLDITLTDTEKAALEEAQEIRTAAHDAAKQVLTDAGISDERMQEIHNAMHEARHASHKAVKAAIEANDYEAFKTAVADSPMAETIDSMEKFAKLVEAHELRVAGDHEAAKAIMEELGLTGRGMGGHGMGGGRGGDRPFADN